MTTLTSRPVIGITMGDPIGIGPEILIKALCNPEVYQQCKPLILGDKNIIDASIKLLNAPVSINSVNSVEQGVFQHKTIDLIEISRLEKECAALTQPTAETGKAMENYIIKGISLAMENRIAGLVTCPITKTAMKLAGSRFHGHTELLAHNTQSKQYAMMLAGEKLRVVLVTIHIPLAQVPQSLTIPNILNTIQITHEGLKKRLNIESPHIGVAGLNPHSGEASMFGTEEKDLIIPAVELAKENGIRVTGPLPPDTIFLQASRGEYDAVVCMYHDQGLIPFKMIHFEDGVNTTLGLPIIRTSVDHGTAYDIAWKGIADSTSLEQAIRMAAFQARNIGQ